MQHEPELPVRAADHHRLMERLANTQVSEEQAREVIRSPEAYRAFLAQVAAGLPAYALRASRAQ